MASHDAGKMLEHEKTIGHMAWVVAELAVKLSIMDIAPYN